MSEDDKARHYEVYAIRYATREGRRRDNFIGGDPHDGPMPMDYFVWMVVGPERRFVVDCGFTAEIAARRKRTYLRDPVEALQLLGVHADDVTDVVLTHLHYDHVGNFDRFRERAFISKSENLRTRRANICDIRFCRVLSRSTMLPASSA